MKPTWIEMQPFDVESDALPLRHGSYFLKRWYGTCDTKIIHLRSCLLKTIYYVYNNEIMRHELYLFKTMYYVYNMIIVYDGSYLFKIMCYVYAPKLCCHCKSKRMYYHHPRRPPKNHSKPNHYVWLSFWKWIWRSSNTRNATFWTRAIRGNIMLQILPDQNNTLCIWHWICYAIARLILPDVMADRQ